MYVLTARPAHGMITRTAAKQWYCDIAGWGIDEDGYLFLMDDCDNIAYPPPDRFKIIFNLRKMRALNYDEEE